MMVDLLWCHVCMQISLAVYLDCVCIARLRWRGSFLMGLTAAFFTDDAKCKRGKISGDPVNRNYVAFANTRYPHQSFANRHFPHGLPVEPYYDVVVSQPCPLCRRSVAKVFDNQQRAASRSEEHTSDPQSLMRMSYPYLHHPSLHDRFPMWAGPRLSARTKRRVRAARSSTSQSIETMAPTPIPDSRIKASPIVISHTGCPLSRTTMSSFLNPVECAADPSRRFSIINSGLPRRRCSQNWRLLHVTVSDCNCGSNLSYTDNSEAIDQHHLSGK